MTLAHSPETGLIPTEQAAPPVLVSEILSKAADLIDKPGAWTQEEFAKAEDGTHWIEDEEAFDGAVCWCALGAVAVATNENPWSIWGSETLAGKAQFALTEVVGFPVAGWNDAPERTQAEVVAALREAARIEAEAGR